jgi:hypothetical protein
MKSKKFNGPASEYALPHTMDDKSIPNNAGVLYPIDPNGCTAEHFTHNMPAARVSLGNPNAPAKTSGIKIRGTGAATKGLMARGPQA